MYRRRQVKAIHISLSRQYGIRGFALASAMSLSCTTFRRLCQDILRERGLNTYLSDHASRVLRRALLSYTSNRAEIEATLMTILQSVQQRRVTVEGIYCFLQQNQRSPVVYRASQQPVTIDRGGFRPLDLHWAYEALLAQ
jgi:hypothetical protein